MGEPERYVAAPDSALRAVALDSMIAIFHLRSGQTHLVASPVPEILAALREPASIDTLMDRLSVAFDVVDADRGGLADRVAELVASGLIERR